MERLDLATYAQDIKSNYNGVVSGQHKYAIFTTLKDSSLKPTALGDGDITDFVSEFEEGSVQFGIMAVNPFGSDVQKLVLIGWCPDSAPLKSKVSYASNFSSVGKVMHYHVDITARDSDDLDVDDIMKRVSNASGARYSIQSLTQKTASTGFKPKPKQPQSPSPEPVSKPIPSVIKPKPLPAKKITPPQDDNDDEWGGEKASEVRDFDKQPLDTLPSAYKPTKVDIDALRNEPKTASVNLGGGISSLPKHKPSNEVLSRFQQPDVVKVDFGTKVPSFNAAPQRDSSKLVGGASRNFGAQGGLTPAQAWAAKKGQFTEVAKDETPVNAADVEVEDIQNVNDAKSKFENLSLNAEKEERKAPVNNKLPVFPPAASEEPKPSLFPPPPARQVLPSKVDTLSKFKKEESEDEEDAWEEKPKPAALPPRQVTAESTPEPEPESESESESESTPASASAPAPLPARPVSVADEKKPDATEEITAIAEYEYVKDEDNEIGFAEGEIIKAIKFVDEDWWFGTNSAGESGLFPATYVQVKKSVSGSAPAAPIAESAAPADPISEPVAASTGLNAVAEYDYDADEDNELTFKEGDIITDIEKVDQDWWLGSLNGEKKLFPANYVTLK